jgi:hypothetical protein
MVWPKQAKSSTCSSLQPVQKKQQEEIKFTFNVGKCDKIFDELLKNGNIKINHTIPSAVELKRRAYCKWHNSFSHATNECNVFRRQIQSAINEGRLKFQEMQVDTEPFPMNVIDFEGKKVLIRPSTADKGKGKEVIIGNTWKADENNKISCREVVAESSWSRTVRLLRPDGPIFHKTVRSLRPDICHSIKSVLRMIRPPRPESLPSHKDHIIPLWET